MERNRSMFARDMVTDLSDSRAFLMGCAILSVVLYHVRAHYICPEGAAAQFLDDIVGMGYGGSDVFFFLSGFGIAWSLKKDGNMGRYLGRRVKKLLPDYYPFVLLYMGAVAWLRGITWTEILGNLTFLGTWFHLDNQFNWYIQTAMAFYLLAPVVYRVTKGETGWKTWGILALAALALQGISFGSYQMIAIARVPVFLLGMFLGTLEKGSLPWTKGRLITVAAVYLAGLVFWRVSRNDLTWGNGLYWYPFLLLAPAGCFLTAGLRPWWLSIPALKKIDDMICLCGKSSYEIYLVHLLFFETILEGRQGNFFWIVMGVVFTALGIGYRSGVKQVL